MGVGLVRGTDVCQRGPQPELHICVRAGFEALHAKHAVCIVGEVRWMASKRTTWAS